MQTANPSGTQPDREKAEQDKTEREAAMDELRPFLDLPFRLQVELGRSSIKVREVLALEPGVVIELNRVTGEANDIVLNNHAIAKGEIVVSEETLVSRVSRVLEHPEAL